MSPEPGPGPRTWVLHILALSGFAIAQPVYDLLRRFAPFLIAHDCQGVDLVLLVLSLSVAVPLILVAPAALAALLSRRVGWALQLITVFILLLLLGLQVTRHWSSAGENDLWFASLAAIGVLGLYWRYDRLRRVLSWLVLPAGVFPLLFLLLSPVRGLLLPGPSTTTIDLRRPANTPVFLLVLDEFPLFALLDEDELIDAERFPNIAALAGDAAWFRNATTVAQSTAYSVPAILSGRYPFREVLLPFARDYKTNLFTLLGGGYNLNVRETATRMCPLDLCTGAIVRPDLPERMRRLFIDLSAVYLHLVTPHRMAARLPSISDGWRGFWGRPEPRRRVDKADYLEAKEVRKFRWDHPRDAVAEFLASIEDFPRPTLHYLHVLLPHRPWRSLPDGHSYDPSRVPGASGRHWTGTEWQIAQGLQRLVLQVGYVDRVIGELRALLETLDLYDESLIVVVADHGLGFRPNEARRWVMPEPGSNLSDIANVPLIVKFPSGSPRGIDDRNAETIDVLPTILDVLRIDRSGIRLDGTSLARPPDARRKAKRIYPTRGNQSARGTPIVYEPHRLAARREMVQFKIRYLGMGGWDTAFALGPYGSLVGESEDSAALLRQSETLTLDRPKSFETVDLGDELLPVWVSGSLGAWSGERWVAAIVNGKVAAVTQTYEAEELERFAALVAPKSLRAGHNLVEVRELDISRTQAGSP